MSPIERRLQAEHAFDQLDRPDETTPYLVQEAVDAFEFGLQRLLDGFEAFITTRPAAGKKAGRRAPVSRMRDRPG
jgi:hypothetical protein